MKSGPYRKWPGKRLENRRSTCKYYVLRYAEQTLMPHFGGGEKASVEINSDSTKSLDPTGIHSALRARRARWSSLASVSAINSSSYAILNSKPDSSAKAGLGFAGPWDRSEFSSNFWFVKLCFRKFDWKSGTRHYFLEFGAKSGKKFIKNSR